MSLVRDGARIFAPTKDSLRWADAAASYADTILSDPRTLAQQDLRHGKTWMVGLDAIPNLADGSLNGVPLKGPWKNHVPAQLPLHRAQLSVVFPGYPQQDNTQSAANHRFRVNRSAAHMDGLIPEGPNNQRYARELHAYILGIALNTNPDSPTVYWPGSHLILHKAIQEACRNKPLQETNLTETYHTARKLIFDTCDCVPVPTIKGGSVLLHRFTLHGTAKWTSNNKAHRAIAFFRPEVADPATWLTDP